MVSKDELDMDSFNKISFLNKNPFFLFHLFHDRDEFNPKQKGKIFFKKKF